MSKSIFDQTHRLYRVENESPKGMNSHRTWCCEINNIYIISNDDILGDKFYIYGYDTPESYGESSKTKWYKSPTAAAIAFNQLKKRALFN
jgi:hypothetical protein